MKTTLLHIKLGDMYDDALAFIHYLFFDRERHNIIFILKKCPMNNK